MALIETGVKTDLWNDDGGGDINEMSDSGRESLFQQVLKWN